MFVSWFSVLSAISIASAVPVSVYAPVRPYVFLAPDLPKFALQPALKLQTPANIQPIQPIQPVQTVPIAKTESSPAKQYVLVYPQYQYLTTRQDDSSNTGFFESIQNYFVNFGSSQTQGDDPSQIMDAVDPDKQPLSDVSIKSAIAPEPVQEKSETKQKFYYSYVTPASTVPLNADRRLFYLSEQPQIFGSFSGSSINPVFNLQPVPVVLSRSNVAQPDDSHPNKIISENVQKFSQIPPVMATVEQVPQVEAKSGVSEQIDAVVVDPVPENRVVPVVQAVEANRAEVLPTEANVPSVVVARSNPVPLSVSADVVSPVAAPVVDGNSLEGNESVQQTDVSVPALKDAQPAAVSVPDVVALPDAVLSDVVRSDVVDQAVQGSQVVESVTASV